MYFMAEAYLEKSFPCDLNGHKSAMVQVMTWGCQLQVSLHVIVLDHEYNLVKHYST